MFYDIFTKLCDEKGMSPTSVLQQMGISTSKLTAWKKGSSPSASVLLLISEFFSVSVDFLLTGHQWDDLAPESEANPEITIRENALQLLNAREKEMLTLFRLLPESEQMRLIGRAEVLAEQVQLEKKVV